MKPLRILPILIMLLLPATIGMAGQGSKTIEDALPKDIDRESRNRLPPVGTEGRDEPANSYNRRIASFPGVPGAGQKIRLHGNPVRNLQAESPVGAALMQLAILVTAREHDQPYEWSLHEMQARAVGLDPAVIEIVRQGKPLMAVRDREAAIITMGREIFRAHKLDSETYAGALSLYGKSNLVDIVSLMADYSRTSAILTAFNQQLPPGWKQFLPLPFTPPTDIHADSRNRLPLIKDSPSGLAPAMYSRTLAPAGTGPAQIRAHGAGLKSLEGSVGRQVIDLAILIAAREHDAQYDWTVNEVAALKDGLESAIVDVVRNRKPVAGLPDKDARIIELGRELFGKHNVSPETYRRALNVFGERDLVDLVDVMGQHSSEATLLSAFDQRLPAGQKSTLPMVSANGKR